MTGHTKSAARVRGIALGLPDAEEVEAWGHPTFRVDGHIFVGLNESTNTANINATLETQAALVGAHPETFSVSPRVGRSGWVNVDLASVAAGELAELIADAWRLTAESNR